MTYYFLISNMEAYGKSNQLKSYGVPTYPVSSFSGGDDDDDTGYVGTPYDFN
jgi:hypothetical protein